MKTQNRTPFPETLAIVLGSSVREDTRIFCPLDASVPKIRLSVTQQDDTKLSFKKQLHDGDSIN